MSGQQQTKEIRQLQTLSQATVPQEAHQLFGYLMIVEVLHREVRVSSQSDFGQHKQLGVTAMPVDRVTEDPRTDDT
jgi:hypothetical protein